MKKKFHPRFIMSMILYGGFFIIGFAQDIIDITYQDKYKDSSSSEINIPTLPKQKRVNSKASSIIVNDGSDFDNDQLQKVVDYVTSVWKSYILNSGDLLIKIEWDNIDSDIETTVRYAHKNNLAYPIALKSYLDNYIFTDNTEPAGIIKINPNTNWDYALGENISTDAKNLAFGLMRALPLLCLD